MPMNQRAESRGSAHRKRIRAQLGERLREIRKARRLTLQEAAMRTGLAPSTLSKIENGQMSPTYDNIVRIAEGFGIDVEALFSGGTQQVALGRQTVTRSGEGKLYATEQYDYEMLCSSLSHKKIIPIVATIKCHDIMKFGDWPRHNGEEFVFVLSGEVVVFLEHYEPVVLRQGDSMYFDSTMAHACVSNSPNHATIVWVCSQSPDL